MQKKEMEFALVNLSMNKHQHHRHFTRVVLRHASQANIWVTNNFECKN